MALVARLEGLSGGKGVTEVLRGASQALSSVALDLDGATEGAASGKDEESTVLTLGTKNAARDIASGRRSKMVGLTNGYALNVARIERNNSATEEDITKRSLAGTEKAGLASDLKAAISGALGRGPNGG